MVGGGRQRETEQPIIVPYTLTEAQRRSRRLRNIAIALVVGFLVVLFYVMTIAKLGAGFLTRPI